jgi:Ca2+-binding RTX toxin-like protein
MKLMNFNLGSLISSFVSERRKYRDADTVKLDLSKDEAITRDLGDGADVVRVGDEQPGQVRVTFTSSEAGNGNPNDSDSMTNQDGKLAVRLQSEDGADGLTGPVSRFDDEGISFEAATKGLTFDVRDLVAGTQRGDQFDVVRLGTQMADKFDEGGSKKDYYINAGMGDDKVTGGKGDDFLVGGAGNDTLSGGSGDDSLLGGGGSDTFLFASGPGKGGLDAIQDFSVADDLILLDSAVFAGLAAGPLAAEAFTLSSAAREADDRIIYNPDTGNLCFDADGCGPDGSVIFANLANRPADLSAADFAII